MWGDLVLALTTGLFVCRAGHPNVLVRLTQQQQRHISTFCQQMVGVRSAYPEGAALRRQPSHFEDVPAVKEESCEGGALATRYGGVAAAIGLLTWMYLTTIVVLLGEAYNAERIELKAQSLARVRAA